MSSLWQWLTGLLLIFSQQQSINPADLTGEFDPTVTGAVFNNQNLPLPQLAEGLKKPIVLGSSTADKRIEVDLTNQRLYAFEDNQMIYNFLISSGKWARTPTGVFEIWGKFRYTKMEGGSKALRTYYYLPNVPFVMFFYNNEIAKSRGFSLHGTYWHSNFGNPMSHGCVNMKTEEAEQIYYWVGPDLGEKKNILASADNPGTQVVIYGRAVWE